MDLRKIKKLIEMLQESDLNEIEVKKVKRVSELTGRRKVSYMHLLLFLLDKI